MYPLAISFLSVNLSSVQEQLSKVPNDSAFSTNGGTDDTANDIGSDLLTGDSGIPVSPGDSVPFPVSPDIVPPLTIEETTEETSLPPWLEAVSLIRNSWMPLFFKARSCRSGSRSFLSPDWKIWEI